jgi:hypothetical protein
MKSSLLILSIAVGVLASSKAMSRDYYNEQWFEYPDPLTAPRITVGCAHEACTKVPVTHGLKISMEQRCVCTNPTQRTELLRKSVRFVVSGPDTGEEAARRAIEGIAAGCAVSAITTAKVTAAAAPSPEPAARIGAATGALLTSFKACILGVSASGVAGAIVRQLSIGIRTEDHWARL